MNYPSGKTHLLLLIDDPVAHVRAAQFINPIFERKKLDAFLVPIHVRAADLSDVVPRLAKLGNVKGLIVTIPHKETIARLCSELGPNAKMVGAVNVARIEASGRLVGEMFDGEGLLATAQANSIGYKGRFRWQSPGLPRRRRGTSTSCQLHLGRAGRGRYSAARSRDPWPGD